MEISLEEFAETVNSRMFKLTVALHCIKSDCSSMSRWMVSRQQDVKYETTQLAFTITTLTFN